MIHTKLLDHLGYNLVLSQWLPQSLLLKLDVISLTDFCEKYGNLKKSKLERLKKKTKGHGRPTFTFPMGWYNQEGELDKEGFKAYMKSEFNIEFGGNSPYWLKPYYD
jgi:hypothetical protein